MANKRILVFTVASWNSKVGANSWATLLEHYDSSNVANICIREEMPDSRVCSRYFVISKISAASLTFRSISSFGNFRIRKENAIFS